MRLVTSFCDVYHHRFCSERTGPVLPRILNRLKPGAAVQTTIRVTTDLVVLPASVKDSNGAFFPKLTKENFHVYEEAFVNGVLGDRWLWLMLKPAHSVAFRIVCREIVQPSSR
jgi:hypothetical protein